MPTSSEMPEGVVLEGSLDDRGRCFLNIEVAAAPERHTEAQDIGWFTLRAVISTTYELLCISPSAATRMRLKAKGEVTTDSAQNPGYTTSKAPVAFRVRDAQGSEFTSAFWATIQHTPPEVEAIIGVDQLLLGRITIDGWNRRWRWVFAGEHGVRTHRSRSDDPGRR